MWDVKTKRLEVVFLFLVICFCGCVDHGTVPETEVTNTPDSASTPQPPSPSVVITPTPEPTIMLSPKYSVGDVISSKDEETDIATIILDYNYDTDEYLTTYIFKIGNIWLHLSEKEDEEWCGSDFIEEYESVKISHVNLSDVMSCEEYWEGGGYERYKSIRLRYDFEKEGSIPKNYYETGNILIDDVKQPSIKSLYDVLMQIELPIYKEDEFMCGHASTYLEWYLEGSGFNTTIITGFNNPTNNTKIHPPTQSFSLVEHAWIVVYLPKGKVAIESTYLCDGDNYLPPAIVIDKYRKYERYSFTYKEYEDYKRMYDSSKYIVPESFDEFVEDYYYLNITSLSNEYYDFYTGYDDIYECLDQCENMDWWNKQPYCETIKW